MWGEYYVHFNLLLRDATLYKLVVSGDKKSTMRKFFFISCVCCSMLLLKACTPSVNTPLPISNTLIARWTLTQVQSAGTGGPGVWRVANPAGQWLECRPDGTLAGTVFPAATSYRIIDSATVEFTDITQPGGVRSFHFTIDTVSRMLRLFIKPPGGMVCIEGCGGYGFER